jgi:hypothetical protein
LLGREVIVRVPALAPKPARGARVS